MPTAEELRAAGNESFKAKRYIQALNSYNEALQLDKTNIAIYNNLAAASHQLGNYEDAKRHARDGLRVEKSAKGHIRLAAACWALQQFDESTKAYEDALAMTPDDATVKKALEDVKQAKEKAASSSSASNNNTTRTREEAYQHSQQQPTFHASPPPPAGSGGEPQAMMLDMAVIAASVLHLLTMLFAPGLASTLWKVSLGAMAARQFLILRPSFQPNLAWAKSLPSSFAGQYLGLCVAIMLAGSPPLHLLMASMCIYAACDIVFAHQGLFVSKVPPQLTGRLMPYLEKIRLSRDHLFANAAMCEVAMGIMLPLSGAGGIVMIGFWYFLKFRYLSDRYSKFAFQAMCQQAGKLFYHPKCPAFIGNLFTKLQAALHKMAIGN